MRWCHSLSLRALRTNRQSLSSSLSRTPCVITTALRLPKNASSRNGWSHTRKGKPQRWFERDFEVDKYNWTLGTNLRGEKSQRNTWRKFTRANALFLSTAVQLNNEQLRPVFSWFQGKLGVVTINNSMNMALSMELLNDPSRNGMLNQFIRAADIGIEKLEFREERIIGAAGPVININVMPGGHQILPGFMPNPLPAPKFGRVMANHKQTDSDDVTQLDLFADKSEGTKKIFEFAGGWIKALHDGATLFVDELDRSLHPLMTRFLVQLFHDEKRNAKGAQLVFTTNDTTLLDNALFRRDQIWFVEKDKQASTHSIHCSNTARARTRRWSAAI